MKKLSSIKFLAAAVAVATSTVLAVTNTAHAGFYDYYNHSNSAYSINVYEMTRCRDTRHTVSPGRTYGDGNSYRVNAYSKYKIGSGSYTQLIPPNTCVSVLAGQTVTVYVYSNA